MEEDCKLDFSDHPNALPDGFVKKPSPIHGEGIFTTYDWPCNTQMITSHFKIYGQIQRGGAVGAFINHSNEPNCKLKWQILGSMDIRTGALVSKQSIKAGEELTLDYFVEECGKGIKTCNK